MKNNNIIKSIMALLLTASVLSGCNTANVTSENQTKENSEESLIDRFLYWAFPQDFYEKASKDALLSVKDYDALYDEPFAKDVMYLTVGEQQNSGDGKHSWEEINEHELSWYEERGEEPYYCDALVQFGNDDGPTSDAFGYGNMSANATVRLSGEKSSKRQQKSYRIKINPGSGNVSGIKTFILSKSFTDPFRFTNKLCYDLLTDIDELLSTRTRFVHLYVRDEQSEYGDLFVDYGLYTMVEAINKRYLNNRRLDGSGELYKAENFDFGRHSDVIMQPTSSGYDQKKFEELLEAKGSDDYSSLIKMLDAVNDPEISIRDIVKTYFDEDNIYTFMAFNILMDNKDTDTENFYIYSPTGSDRFYFIPWDNDGALREDYKELKDADYTPGWEKGIYLYTDSVLFSRMLKDQHCVDELSERIKELHDSELSSANVFIKVKKMAKKVKRYLYDAPDMAYARVTQDNYDNLILKIPEQIDRNYYAYYDSLETPAPFHINEPEIKDGELHVNWDESYCLNGNVSYDVEISDSWDFSTVKAKETDIKETVFSAGKLSPGQYFVKVTAKSDNGTGLTQEAYEFYNTEKKTTVRGVLCFYIREDGTVEKSIMN
ncbi:CotH kinase family protein [Oribacterium sp. WCC10]|uniref:CotH kinase family protein n=1 Tax=Oribacterium sp. WCC10 TaxID=1855343 RepID=UPI0008F128D6|nr:CotH kinase family protein [Oribacterium sp. WCC10]SFG26109.1 spore coat protein H [Oribacterium sp. WCC10]